MLFLTDMCDIRPGIDTMFDNKGIKVGHLCVGPGKDVLVFLEERFVGGDFFRRACNANGNFHYDSRFDGNIDFYGGGNIEHIAGIGFLNQSICHDGRKYLVLTT
jgi:hypothetical protein